MFKIELVREVRSSSKRSSERCSTSHGRTVSIGRTGSNASLWCGNYGWLSGVAARFICDEGRWWLLNPGSQASVRYISKNQMIDVQLRPGGTIAVPSRSGRLWLSSAGLLDRAAVELLVDITDFEPPALVTEALAFPTPSSGTAVLRPPTKVAETIAVATWHRRRRTLYRYLTQQETAAYLDVTVRIIKDRVRIYREQLETFGLFIFAGERSYFEVCTVAMDYGLIDESVDKAIVERCGSPPPLPKQGC